MKVKESWLLVSILACSLSLPISDVAIAYPQPSALLKQNSPSILLQRQGVLEQGDRILQQDQSLYDDYTFQGEAGQRVTINVESQEFDTYLLLVGPDGNVIQQNDDADANNTNSALEITLPRDGTYTAIVNSYDQNGRGHYALTISSPSSATAALPNQSSRTTQDCDTALQAASNRITQGRNVRVQIARYDNSEIHQSYPDQRPLGYTFGLEGSAAETIMNWRCRMEV